WALVGLAGVAGCVRLWRHAPTGYLGLVGLLTLGVSLIHFVGTRKLPYARTCGFFLPILVLGATHLVEAGLRRTAECWRSALGARHVSDRRRRRLDARSARRSARSDLRARRLQGRASPATRGRSSVRHDARSRPRLAPATPCARLVSHGVRKLGLHRY